MWKTNYYNIMKKKHWYERLKQKKRVLKNLHVNIDRLSQKERDKLHIWKTTGKPCSCAMCSPGKINKNKNKYKIKNKIKWQEIQ